MPPGNEHDLVGRIREARRRLAATARLASAPAVTSSGARDLSLTRALNPDLQTFGTWLSANAAKIPL